MQEVKFGSAFRLSSKKCDSLKMKNSLGELLGDQATKRFEEPPRDSDLQFTPTHSTSNSVRCSSAVASPSKDEKVATSVGSRSSDNNLMNFDFTNILFGPQMGLFAKSKNPIDTTQLDFFRNILNGLNKQPIKYNQAFSSAAVKDESNPQQHLFFTKLDQLRNLEQQIAGAAQATDNKKSASQKMDIQKRKGSYHEISSLNSLDEEIEMNTKPPTQLNHLSISSTGQLENLSLSTVKSETSVPTKTSDKGCFSQSMQDLSSVPLQQRLELHHIKNRRYKTSEEELEGKGTSKSIPGTYTLDERINKILQYKKKIVKWRIRHPPNRSFSGRSAVAGSKPRIKGKFVKKDEYQKYMDSQEKNSKN
jgi:hypothetical protein